MKTQDIAGFVVGSEKTPAQAAVLNEISDVEAAASAVLEETVTVGSVSVEEETYSIEDLQDIANCCWFREDTSSSCSIV